MSSPGYFLISSWHNLSKHSSKIFFSESVKVLQSALKLLIYHLIYCALQIYHTIYMKNFYCFWSHFRLCLQLQIQKTERSTETRRFKESQNLKGSTITTASQQCDFDQGSPEHIKIYLILSTSSDIHCITAPFYK